MEKDYTFVGNYSEYLDTSGDHLTYASLSLYINFTPQLSEKEKRFIETHLENCPVCRTRFEEVFDAENEFDETKEQILLRRTPSLVAGMDEKTAVRLQSDDRSVIALLHQDSKGALLLTFERIPSRFLGHGIRLTLPNMQVVIRIVSARATEALRLHEMQSIPLHTFQTLQLEMFGKITGEERSSLGNRFAQVSFLKYAAAAVVLIGLSTAAVLYLMRGTDEEKIVESGAQPPEPVVTSVLDPENFKVHPILESFIDRTLRSASGVKILAPRNGDTLGVPIAFRWDAQGGKKNYGVTIVNNRNTSVWQAVTRDSHITLQQELSPGLYYMKLEVNGSLERVQKFFITSGKE